MQQNCLTSISDQERHQMCLFLRKNFDEVLKINDTSACEKLQQLIITITRLRNIDEMFSLWPRDTFSDSKLVDKGVVRVHTVQQVDTVDTQCMNANFIDRPSIAKLNFDICISNTQ